MTTMMKEYNIFYSWQSDDKHTRNVIKSKIKDACNALKNENMDVHIVEDSRTENGAEHIDTGLLQSIDSSDLFIADVTPVLTYKHDGKAKLSPNGNVLFETGYAVATLGDGQCKLVARLEEGQNFHELPFDINHRKLLTFSNDDKTPLNAIKDWILLKIPEIDAQRESAIPLESAIILCANPADPELGNTSGLTLHPHFMRTTYIQPQVKHTAQNCDALQSVVLGKTNSINAMLDNYRERAGIQIVKPSLVKPITRETNESLVPLQLIIDNNGQTQLIDINIKLWSDNEEVSFHHTPITEQFQMPIIRKDTDFFICEDGKRMGMTIPKLNATDAQVLGEIFVKLPFEESDIQIHWNFTSSTIHRDGIITIHSIPTYEDEFEENASKAGNIEHSCIIRTE